ncbi:hypothetical protein [Dongia sedimenti]|uniref:Lipoprotein n=1 Tax=Dongia sedimenti TaxID=3064282 RepID=A0ABU0YRA3_9PROT|nr:hypothetical protein [Rhodospirillaceae bacterium R-7]
MTRLSLIIPLLLALTAGCASPATQSAGYVFRDCSDCPELVVVRPAGGGPNAAPAGIAVGRFEVTRDEFAVFEREDTAPSPHCFFTFAIETYEDSMTRQHPGLGGIGCLPSASCSLSNG